MDVRLLGPLEVRLGDGPVELGPRKQRAVLAMLALEVGRTVSADRLAEGLWGQDPPPSAPKMVQLYVSHLRAVLDGDGCIATRGRGYELQVPGNDVDAVRFERLLEESRAREALALWRGEALADVADEPFAAAEIRRLEELRLRAAELAIDADLAAGRHAEVIGELDALVAANPLRERLHAQRMLALYRAGRQSEALAAYRDARAGLVDEIGVEPGAELQRLHDQILAHDAALDPPAAAEREPVGASRAPPRRRSRAALVGAAALLLAGVLAFGIIRVLEPEGLPGIDENSIGVIDPGGERITAQYGVGRSPGAVTAGGGSVWVANRLDGTVSRIERDRQITTIDVGGAPTALAFGAGSLWVADGDGRTVAQVDPGTNKVLQRIEAANAPRSLALAEGALWVVSGADGGVYRVGLAGGRAPRAIPIGPKATALTAGAGALWVASEEAGTVTRIDPRSGKIVAPINVGNAPNALAVGEGAVWVVNRHDGTLSRLDPEANTVRDVVRVGSDPTAVAVGEGAVWVAGGEEGTVVQVDPRGPRVLRRLGAGSSPSALAVADGSVWTAAVAPDAAHRGGTLRVDMPSSGGAAVNWLHPDGWFWVTWMTSSLAYDGLVAYRRVPGIAGATLVGGLATRPPAPSSDRRTYVFTLRRGIRYSDGTPVRPEDFRASIERVLRTNGDAPRFLAGIVGARRCTVGGRCDLARGIESDPRARTVTVHLTAPDPEFLHKLSLPFAFVVPAGASARAGRRTSCHPAPGRTASPAGTIPPAARWSATRTSGRPPRDQPGSPIGSSSGSPRWGGSRRTPHRSNAAASMSRGSKSCRCAAVSAELLARAPGRLISGPATSTFWMFLNARRPPFDDSRVRRAVNLATDRAELVERYGGAEVVVRRVRFCRPRSRAIRPIARTRPRRRAAPGGPRQMSRVRAS